MDEFIELKALIMDKLNEHSKELKEIHVCQTSLKVDIATLKAKASSWGAMFGLVSGGVIAVVIKLIT